jgi:hypothetical protein
MNKILNISNKVEKSDKAEKFYTHRFVMGPDHESNQLEVAPVPAYLMIKSVEFVESNHLYVLFYMTQETVNFIEEAKFPDKLTISLLNGYGKSLSAIKLNGVRFIEYSLNGLKFDYSDLGIPLVMVILVYNHAKLIGSKH